MSDATVALNSLERLLVRSEPRLLLAPPRTCSTVLARALTQHSLVGSYIHEPCDLYAHREAGLKTIVDRLAAAGWLGPGIVKEMTFQLGVGEVGRLFLHLARKPVLFLIRDPRLAVESRIRMVAGDLARNENTPAVDRARIEQATVQRDYSDMDDLIHEGVFPLYHTGWDALGEQIEFCRSRAIDYAILEAQVLRAHPRECLRTCLERSCGTGKKRVFIRGRRKLGAFFPRRPWHGCQLSNRPD